MAAILDTVDTNEIPIRTRNRGASMCPWGVECGKVFLGFVVGCQLYAEEHGCHKCLFLRINDQKCLTKGPGTDIRRLRGYGSLAHQ